jgi:chemotaxis protein methyltransferase CheR
MSLIVEFTLSDEAFKKFRALIYEKAGISMSDAKRSLVAGRLRKRLVALNLESYSEYYRYLKKDDPTSQQELQRFVDLLTTNETWFFREERHFEFMRTELGGRDRSQPIEIWSAASSSGEEPYSIAMTLAEMNGLSRPWQIHATDISSEILSKAKKGIYLKSRIKGLSDQLKRKYMLKGSGAYEDYLAIVPELKKKVSFHPYNLTSSPLPSKKFDIIFCRNVLIYFDQETKKKVVRRLTGCLKPGGYFFPGHAESLHGFSDELRTVEPSIYQRVKGVSRG